MNIKSFIAGCLCAIVAGSFVGGVTGYLETHANDFDSDMCLTYECAGADRYYTWSLTAYSSGDVILIVDRASYSYPLYVAYSGSVGYPIGLGSSLDGFIKGSSEGGYLWNNDNKPVTLHIKVQPGYEAVRIRIEDETYLVPVCTQANLESRAFGDINLDGSITAADAQLVLQYYLESEVLGNDIPDIVSWANA